MDDAEGNHVEPAITLLALHLHHNDEDDDNEDVDEDNESVDDDMMMQRYVWQCTYK